jgi:hypothetical protein
LLVLLSSFVRHGKRSLHQTRLFKNTFAYPETGKLHQNNEVIELGNYYIPNHEVPNAAYQEFLTTLEAEGHTEELITAQIDAAQWEKNFE